MLVKLKLLSECVVFQSLCLELDRTLNSLVLPRTLMITFGVAGVGEPEHSETVKA